ncbi:hypothetical protein HXZ23_24460 [Escherichia coli]|uniref:hypothetical protein n=1 Tax=Escherichia coli TaxID=562 RepID=UPI002574F14C|nr:hypothetical protein [Escherichia coli]MDM1202815.1 hypothetical protein [Escherichia coli]
MNTRELISSLSLIVRDLETAAAEHGIDYTAIVREARQLLRRGKAPPGTTLRPECPAVGCQNASRGAVYLLWQ